MAQYLPLFRPGQTITFDATSDVVGGTPVQVGSADRSVAPAAAASTSYVGVAGHDAAAGEKVTVELGRPVHLLTAAGAIARGAQVEAAGNGRVQTATTGTVIGTALTAAADGAAVEILA